MSVLKSTFGSSKSVSLAVPASYWYLKAFPIEDIATTVDYIVYLTYDLHGQWDYGNKWTSPGCPTGNCLRSHVNLTETKDALSLITKAGVPSNKVVVGVTSYGRSFKMAQAGCTGPSCKFTGSPRVSNAAKGRCTGTSGYLSDAEIDDIITFGRVNKQWVDADSNILVYNDTEWVAYMNVSTKEKRAGLYASYNFAGTSDWAVDLEDFLELVFCLSLAMPMTPSVLIEYIAIAVKAMTTTPITLPQLTATISWIAMPNMTASTSSWIGRMLSHPTV